MDIFDLKEKKKAAGLTNQEIADYLEFHLVPLIKYFPVLRKILAIVHYLPLKKSF